MKLIMNSCVKKDKATKVVKETPTEYGYVICEEYWPVYDFEFRVISDPHDDAQELVDELNQVTSENDETLMTTCYTDDGYWIGNEETAEFLCKEIGIRPIPKPFVEKGELYPCSIGFCEKDQKWYGWSHRAIFGFGIGDVVKEGDCTSISGWTKEYLEKHPEADKSLPVGFEAKNLDDARRMAEAFAHSVG